MLSKFFDKKKVYLLILLVSFLFLIGCSSDGDGSNNEKYTVGGVITDSNNNPITNVKLNFSNGFGIAKTDSNGRWSKTGLSGEVKITPVKEGYTFKPSSINISEENTNIKFTTNLEIKIPETTKVLKDEDIKSIISISDNSLRVSKDSSTIKKLSEDDIITGGITDKTPKGMLRKVTDIKEYGDEIILETTSASLDETIEQGSFHINKRLTPEDIDRAMTDIQGVKLLSKPQSFNMVDFEVALNDVVLFDYDNNLSTTADQIKANGAIGFNYNIDFSGRFKYFELTNLRFENILTEKENIKIELGSSVKDFIGDGAFYEKTIKTIRMKSIKFTVGPVPIVLTPKIKLNIGIDGDLYGKVSMEITRENEIVSGVEYENGKWNDISERDTNSIDWQTPSFDLRANVKAYAGPELECDLYEFAGPYGEIYGNFQFEGDVFAEPSWTLYGGLEAKAGVELEVLSKTLANKEKRLLIIKRLLPKMIKKKILKYLI
mgnify:CR=1 FL=1